MELSNFKKNKEFLVCVDSDGCVMDTMDIKHYKCFGPCMVEEWGLAEWEDAILKRWNEINLYTMTRGINRFKGLAKALCEIDKQYCRIEGVDLLEKWVSESPELSNPALSKAIAENDCEVLKKALSWSKKVNEKINELPFDVKLPFKGAKEGLAFAHQFADVAVVSSANRAAVVEEWERYGLLEHIDVIMTQDVGSKAYCIGEMVAKGYDKDKVVMLGDAPGDYDAAKKNGVFYFPILVKNEKCSWDEFKETALNKLMDGTFGGDYQQKKADEFTENLK